MSISPDGTIDLRPVVREGPLARGRRRRRPTSSPGSSPSRVRTTRFTGSTASTFTSPACGRRILTVADTATHTAVKTVGPFAAAIRPFTVNGRQTLCFVNVNGLLGFEVGDLTTGKKLHRVEVEGFQQGPVKRHGCPSHGIGLTPDEKELWVVDAFNKRLHIFDATVMPPKQIESIKLRDEPGWVTFTIDGRLRLPVDRRGDRHQDAQDRRPAQGRERPADPEREAARDRLRSASPSRTEISSASEG